MASIKSLRLDKGSYPYHDIQIDVEVKYYQPELDSGTDFILHVFGFDGDGPRHDNFHYFPNFPKVALRGDDDDYLFHIKQKAKPGPGEYTKSFRLHGKLAHRNKKTNAVVRALRNEPGNLDIKVWAFIVPNTSMGVLRSSQTISVSGHQIEVPS